MKATAAALLLTVTACASRQTVLMDAYVDRLNAAWFTETACQDLAEEAVVRYRSCGRARECGRWMDLAAFALHRKATLEASRRQFEEASKRVTSPQSVPRPPAAMAAVPPVPQQ